MKASYWFGSIALLIPLFLASCRQATDKPREEDADALQAARAKLSPEDQRLVEAQDFCPVSDKRLGSMGPPVKETINGQPVFLCCQSCEKEALAEPDKTLEKVDELKEVKAARAKLGPEDQRLAEAQDYCPIMEDHRLGSMGKPFKVVIKDQPVFLCCKSCQRKALADPDKTLAKIEELKAKNKAASLKQ